MYLVFCIWQLSYPCKLCVWKDYVRFCWCEECAQDLMTGGTCHASGNFTQSQFPRFHLAKKTWNCLTKRTLSQNGDFHTDNYQPWGGILTHAPVSFGQLTWEIHGTAICSWTNGELSGLFAFQEISKHQIHFALFFVSFVSSSGEKICPSFCHSWNPLMLNVGETPRQQLPINHVCLVSVKLFLVVKTHGLLFKSPLHSWNS